jgi:hypothetical protein
MKLHQLSVQGLVVIQELLLVFKMKLTVKWCTSNRPRQPTVYGVAAFSFWITQSSLLSFLRLRQLSRDAPSDTGFMLRAVLRGTINLTPGINIYLVL